MAGMPWVKIYTEMLDDVKMSRLTDAQKWRFVQLILLAGECDAGGALVTGDTCVSHEEVTWRLRCESQKLEDDIKKLVEVGLITDEESVIEVIKFSERQGPAQSEKREKWQIRQERHRNKAKINNVTGESRVSHALEEEKKKIKNNGGNIVFPDCLNNSQFQETWIRWEKFRQETKHKLTPSTVKSQLGMLSKYGSIVGATMIEQSIQNGWQGLFEVKSNGNNNGAKPHKSRLNLEDV